MLKFLSLFKFYSKYTSGKQPIVILLAVMVSFIETIGFFTLAPLFSASEYSEDDFASIPVLLIHGFFSFVGLEVSFERLLLFLIVIFSLKGVCLFLMLKHLGNIKANLLFMLRERIMTALGKSAFDAKNEVSSSSRLNIYVKQTENVATLYFSLISVITLLVNSIVFSFASLLVSPISTLAAVIFCIFYWSVMGVVNNRVKKISETRARLDGKFLDTIDSLLHGFEYFKSTERTGSMVSRTRSEINEIRKKDYLMSTLQSFSQALREPMLILVLTFMLFSQLRITDGEVGELLVSLILLFKALSSLLGVQSSFTAALANAGSQAIYEEEVNRLRSLTEEAGEREFQFVDSIKFNNVSFTYEGCSKNIIKDATFEIMKGEKVAIVGESGSGKSTLLRLLMMNLRPSKGSITIDGVNVSEIKKSSYRNSLGYVSQGNTTVSGSLYENIVLGREFSVDSDSNRVKQVLGVVHLEQFANDDALHSKSSFSGRETKYSGGQLQRIAVARELVGRPIIYFLDEPSSALDDDTQEKLRVSLNNELNNDTVIIVSHRKDFVRNVDKTLYISDGKIRIE